VVAPQVHLPLTQRPEPHCESRVQAFAWQLPATAPVHVWVLPQVALEHALAAQSPMGVTVVRMQLVLPQPLFAVHWQNPAMQVAPAPQAPHAFGTHTLPVQVSLEVLHWLLLLQVLIAHEL
jgi:hypothetical protein